MDPIFNNIYLQTVIKKTLKSLVWISMICMTVQGCSKIQEVPFDIDLEPLNTGGSDSIETIEMPSDEDERIDIFEDKGLDVESTIDSFSRLYDEDPAVFDFPEEYEEAVEDDKILQYAVFYFDFDSYALSEETKEIMRRHAQFMNASSSVSLRIEGHTDERGSADYNYTLGKKRANSIKNVLVKNDVNPKQITVTSYGEEKPAVEGDTEKAFSKNRRGELVYQ